MNALTDTHTLEEVKFRLNSDFAISQMMKNMLNSNPAFHYVFKNISIIAYIPIAEFQKTKFANTKIHKFTTLSKVVKSNSVLILILYGYMNINIILTSAYKSQFMFESKLSTTTD